MAEALDALEAARAALSEAGSKVHFQSMRCEPRTRLLTNQSPLAVPPQVLYWPCII